MLVNINSIKRLILKKKCVTFDVFDTLLIRKSIVEPSDLFYFLARNKGLDHGKALEFKANRIKCESLQREISYIGEQHSEIHLENIYKTLSRKYDITSKDEISFEKSNLERRSKILDIYNFAKANGKKIFAISDFYLKSKELEEILTEKNLCFDGVYTSAEHKCGKYEIKLFERFLSDTNFKPEDVLHIGDNSHADYISAMKSGIDAIHIDKSSSELFRDQTWNLIAIHEMVLANEDDLKFFGTQLAYIANRRESEQNLSATQRFGCVYAVPLIYYFCQWLIERAELDKVKNLYLMARDGHTVAEILRRTNTAVKFEVFNISRRCILFPAASIDKSIWERFFTSAASKKISAILADLEIEALEHIISILPERGNISFSELSQTSQIGFLRDSYKLALPQMERECTDYRVYAEKIGLLNEDIAVVDVGWALSSHQALEMVLGRRIRGYYLGRLESAYAHEKISAYLFENFEGESAQWRQIFHSAVELLELPFVSCEDQVVRVMGDHFIYRKNSVLDTVRSMVAEEIRSEVILFLESVDQMIFNSADTNKAKTCIRKIFNALAMHPTSYEYFNICTLPHDRFIAGSGVETIGDYWKTSSLPIAISSERGIRGTLLAVRRHVKLYGLFATTKKIIKKIMG